MSPTVSLGMADDSHPGEARRRASRMAEEIGFTDEERGQVALIVTELGTNLVRHARGGELLLRHTPWRTLEIMSVDRGPGMAEPARCLADGFSTGGTAGRGLGAVQRVATTFDLHTEVGRGTVLLAEVAAAKPKDVEGYRIGGVSIPMRGETECGDVWSFKPSGRQARVSVIDGLGHGQRAAEAARAAACALEAMDDQGTVAALEAINHAISATRGAAMAIAEIDEAASELRLAGVGNVTAIVDRPSGTQTLVMSHGTVGQRMGTVREYRAEWDDSALLLMFSDGLSNHWRVNDYPGLRRRHPSIIAAVLYRDHGRPRDDVTVVAVRGATRPDTDAA